MARAHVSVTVIGFGLVLVGGTHSQPLVPARQAPRIAIANDNRTPAGRVVDGVFTLRLEARAVDWFPEDTSGAAIPIFAFAEAGEPASVPGPLIRVPAGTAMHVTVHNTLTRPMVVRGLQDRTNATLDSIVLAAGALQEIRFRADVPGTYYYWGRTQPVPPIPGPGRGRDSPLLGAFIVDPAGTSPREDERILVISMWGDTAAALGIKSDEADRVLRRESVPRASWLLFAVNGRSWPFTERLSHTVGDTVRWRVINGAQFPHPMHLHGFHFNVDARGSAQRDTVFGPLQRRVAVTEWMTAGSTLTMSWVAARPGNWLFHCHFVTHISEANRAPTRVERPHSAHHNHAEQGMAGLVLGIRVAPLAGTAPARDPSPRRRLRVFITERANVYDNQPGYSYVLQEGATPPAPDSIRPLSSTLVLRQNEPTEITVINGAKHVTAVHWHGIELESFYDGVGDWSGWGTRVAPPIAPGDSFVVRLTPPRPGTFIYHTHVNEGVALASGLNGALLVLPESAPPDTTERVFLFSNGGPHDDARPLINGSATPPPIELRAGVAHRFRFINITPLEAPTVQLMSGSVIQQWRALAKDGADLPAHQSALRPAVLTPHPGETFDFEVKREKPESLTLAITALETVANRAAHALDRRTRGLPPAPPPRLVIEIPVVVR
ncbi:MAG: multicopper oxidase domain-containing protein [Longimicrobiales bacterium]